MCAAPKGNQFWKLADPECLGKPRNYPKPKDLWEACKPYFEYVDNNPIISTETTQSDKYNSTKVTQHKRPYTWEGLYVYLGVSHLKHYKEREDFLPIITHIGNIIRNQKFEGAAAGIFNSNIIARDLGLKDSKEISGSIESGVKIIELPDNNRLNDSSKSE